MNKTNIPDLAESYVTEYERDYENDLPSLKFLLWFFPIFALGGFIFALIVFGVYSVVGAQENESSYPLRATGYTIPTNPYRQLLGEGSVWPTHEQQMTVEQQLDFGLVQGHPIPLETVRYLARPVVICRDSFGCFETGLVNATELIVWTDSDEPTFDNHPAIIVYKNVLFTDFYMIAVFSTFELGDDGNPHPRGWWWVKIEDFRRVFPEVG